ncbi:unnamed protein product [Phyllotreta striolata]|uniref:C2H2-type domain-containing protein n=1 Tax=Phyllotreta striolata TaxID=444603 RepID=A0A9N9TQA3_PHYSR|nr:unnamed protein product [Phyllotreta striolata]
MENTDSYLHKKFKKQVNIQNDKENKIISHAEQKEEKTDEKENSSNRDCVPNQSTNNSPSLITVNANSKSSISVGNQIQPPSNPYISCVVSKQFDHQPVSFDTKFKHQQTNYSDSQSSILDYEANVPDDYSSRGGGGGGGGGGEEIAPPAPDKNATVNGKYVCPYCNLVCSKPSVLQKHIRAHTNERPYPCESCGFSFKTRSNLYKHCRSRTHANRLMGGAKTAVSPSPNCSKEEPQKPYKPRFHISEEEPVQNSSTSEFVTHQINEIINRNNLVTSSKQQEVAHQHHKEPDEPLNLTNKNRKRSLSEVSEPVIQKSLIKELLLKNLSSSDMQCPYCKMIFQTVTELDVHKYRSCKGKPVSSAKYARSSSVNVASILTHNKNAFDEIPQLQNVVFPLSSPGPFLGKTRLIDSDKTKSFSFDSGRMPLISPGGSSPSPNYLLSPVPFEKDRKTKIKLFGGEVKIHLPGETKSFAIDDKFEEEDIMSENRVVKTSLQSGGTVLTNKTGYNKPPEGMMMSPNVDLGNYSRFTFNFDKDSTPNEANQVGEFGDFSQKAFKMLTPNIRPPTFPVTSKPVLSDTNESKPEKPNLYNPLNLYVNGKIVRHVPGMPGPVVAAETPEYPARTPPKDNQTFLQPDKVPERSNKSPNISTQPTGCFLQPDKTPKPDEKTAKPDEEMGIKKFVRPNSLALKPTLASLKQHHGLTPTMFNQILISPDTPRVAKKYEEHFLHGNYFSYLGLKCSTRSVYCTLNKTQPFYVPFFKKLSMYSEWRQQDTKQDKLYASRYDSGQTNQRYSIAGKTSANLIIHSSYKFMVSETSAQSEKEDDQQPQKTNAIMGNYENYVYVRGRGRGRYVCDQCGIRCKKPSMLKKHIRTHSNERPYTCSHCNFSFKTKGNLTKHMKSKSHSKNSTNGNGSSSSSAQQSAQSSDSDTEDSGMDSSDESTRQQEHEAAYGLLSLSQKPTRTPDMAESDAFMTTEEIAHVSQANYAKNKILNEQNFNLERVGKASVTSETSENRNVRTHLGMGGGHRPLTYPYSLILPCDKDVGSSDEHTTTSESCSDGGKSIKQFHVIQKYAREAPAAPKFSTENVSIKKPLPTLKVNDVVITGDSFDPRKRKISVAELSPKTKLQRNDQVIDLSMSNNHEKVNGLRNVQIQISNNSTPKTLEPHTNDAYRSIEAQKNVANDILNVLHHKVPAQRYEIDEEKEPVNANNRTVIILRQLPEEQLNVNSYNEEPIAYDNSAMETLADIATKQVKLEKNTLAKNVASEFLKLATKNDCRDPVSKDVNEIIVKSEGNKSCTICSKSFSKPSQLRLHMNIHYLERPFRCDSCSVSFRTKGHLQKHERSASHHNKLSSSPALSSSEPRPFKCSDCSIAFRIHGHLAKHLRSKMHIQKLECLAKIPFGLYAELERSNSLLTEINTSDGDQCLESLKMLAKKVFVNDPNKLNQLERVNSVGAD